MTPRGPDAEGDDLDVLAFAGKLVVDDRPEGVVTVAPPFSVKLAVESVLSANALASLLVGPEIDLDTELVC